MTTFAVGLVVIAACAQAVGARVQHAAVHATIGDGGLKVRSQLQLLRNPRWLLGLFALGFGALLHAVALGLAPLSVVQPVGVLALPITVLLNARQNGMAIRNLNLNAVLAVCGATGGVAAFVVLAAGSATATPVLRDDQVTATQLVGAAVVLLGVLGLFTRSKVRCMAYAAGCAVAYGLVSLLVRAVAQQIGSTPLLQINPAPLLVIVVAVLVGGWLLQHGYASGPPDLVVACLTVIDPLIAVSLGIGLLGEADKVGSATAVGEVLCGLVACAGVFALARFHPETEQRRVQSTDADAGGAAIASRSDRSDGRVT